MMGLTPSAHGCAPSDLPSRKASQLRPAFRYTSARRCPVARSYSSQGVAEKSKTAALAVDSNAQCDAHIADAPTSASALRSSSPLPQSATSARDVAADAVAGDSLKEQAVHAYSAVPRHTSTENTLRSAPDPPALHNQHSTPRNVVRLEPVNGESISNERRSTTSSSIATGPGDMLPASSASSDAVGLEDFFTDLLSELSISNASTTASTDGDADTHQSAASPPHLTAPTPNPSGAKTTPQDAPAVHRARDFQPVTMAAEHANTDVRDGVGSQPPLSLSAPPAPERAPMSAKLVHNGVSARLDAARNGSVARASNGASHGAESAADERVPLPFGGADAKRGTSAGASTGGPSAVVAAPEGAAEGVSGSQQDAVEDWVPLCRIDGALLPDRILFGGRAATPGASAVGAAGAAARRSRAARSDARAQLRRPRGKRGPSARDAGGRRGPRLQDADAKSRPRHASRSAAARGDARQGTLQPRGARDEAPSSTQPQLAARTATLGAQAEPASVSAKAKQTPPTARAGSSRGPNTSAPRRSKPSKPQEARASPREERTSFSALLANPTTPATREAADEAAPSAWQSNASGSEAAQGSWEQDLERLWASDRACANNNHTADASQHRERVTDSAAARLGTDASTSGRASSDRSQRPPRVRKGGNSSNRSGSSREQAGGSAIPEALVTEVHPRDRWLTRPVPEAAEAELADRLHASGDWDLTRFLPVARAMVRARLWPQLLLTARHAASQPAFLDSLRRDAAAECALLNQLDPLASSPKSAPAVLALLEPLLSTRGGASKGSKGGARGGGAPPPRMPLRVHNLAIKAAAAAGDVAAAEALFQGIRRAGIVANVVTFGMMIAAYGGAGRWRDAVDQLRLMRSQGVEPNVITYTTLIKACTSAGASDAAVEVFHAMDAVGVKADLKAYNALMAVFAKEPNWEKCWSVLAAMRRAGIQPDIVSYNTILVACERSGQWPRVQEMFARMERASEGSPELAPNQVTYNTVMAAAGRAGEWKQALEIYTRMRDADIAPDKVTMSTLISALDSAGQWELALETFESMEQLGVKPNPHCFNATISALARGSQATLAKAMVQRMRDAGYVPDIFTYAPLIEALGKAGLCTEALQVYEDMQAAGVRPNSYVYTALLNACERDNNWPEAVKLFYAMKDSGVEVKTLGMAARHILYLWPQLLDTMPGPIITAARAAVDSGRAARSTVDQLLRSIPQTL